MSMQCTTSHRPRLRVATRKAWPIIRNRDNIIANMSKSTSHLAALFRSDTQADILARVLLNPDRSYTISDLSRLVGAAYATTHREVQRLIELGLFRHEQVGRAIRVSANQDDPAFPHAAELVRLSHGPSAVLPRVLAGIPGIAEAHIYGSWAARRLGEPGTPPGDVDVLVVGDPPRAAVHEAATAAEHELGRDVSIRIVTPDTWSSNQDLFVRTIHERPMLRLTLETAAP